MCSCSTIFLVSLCFLIFLVFFLLVSGPAVIGHSCCGVPANVLSVCLFVFWAKLIKKINLSKLENYGILYKFASESILSGANLELRRNGSFKTKICD